MPFHISATILFLQLSMLLVRTQCAVPGAPKIWGWQNHQDSELRSALRPRSYIRNGLNARRRQEDDASEKRCGPGIGMCSVSECCSAAGYCGNTVDHCTAPDCLFNFGPACDTNTIPNGESTASVARPKLGAVLYGGAGIYSCTVPGTIALTYDDGPFNYTGHVLDLLQRYNAKATFFITGNNIGKGQIDNGFYPWASVIQRMHNEGHQIGSHTWGHQDLSAVTQQQRRQQLISNEMALRNILGFFPTYLRPPYSSCDSACSADLADLGYHIIYFDLDTEDYLNTLPSQVQTPRNNFLGNITKKTSESSDWLVISHDVHQQSAYSLTEFMLQQIQVAGYKPVTVGECLNDPRENWYRSSPGSVSTATPTRQSVPPPTPVQTGPAKTPTATSDDGSCSGLTGFTCMKSSWGDCCSHAGWCGKTSAYCGEGCQPGFGNCGLGLVTG